MEMELHQLELRYERLRRRSARKERAVLASLSEIGQQVPVVVLEVEGQQAVLLDGYKRVRALKRLGRDTVLATRWELPEPEALLLERLMRTAEAESPLEQGWLLKELSERFGLSASELAKRFDKSTSWVSRRQALVGELPESIQERVRQGQLVAHAAMKHLVPLARANRREAERLAEAFGARQLSSREVGALCAAWRGGSPATRELILSSPELVLRAQQEARRPAEPLGAEQRLLSDFAALAGIARRAAGLLREGGWKATAQEELGRAAQSAQADTESLFTLCRKELGHVGSESADRHSGAA
jgi:ParB family chromosome partitioning protein